MAQVIISDGTMDGKPAVVKYYPDRKQTVIYWGGYPKPDDEPHNHATIINSNPDAFDYIRINGKIVSHYKAKPDSPFARDLEAKGGWIGLFREALDRALRWNGLKK